MNGLEIVILNENSTICFDLKSILMFSVDFLCFSLFFNFSIFLVFFKLLHFPNHFPVDKNRREQEPDEGTIPFRNGKHATVRGRKWQYHSGHIRLPKIRRMFVQLN